ncbi:hypothetical protein GCM10010222_03100 [Streptomyces tanashiensis]|nr:hypothetical protein GCM10010222_03100 [Streptomyces tanashiensis]
MTVCDGPGRDGTVRDGTVRDGPVRDGPGRFRGPYGEVTGPRHLPPGRNVTPPGNPLVGGARRLVARTGP